MPANIKSKRKKKKLPMAVTTQEPVAAEAAASSASPVKPIVAPKTKDKPSPVKRQNPENSEANPNKKQEIKAELASAQPVVFSSPPSSPIGSKEGRTLQDLKPIQNIVLRFDIGAEIWHLMNTLPNESFYTAFVRFEAEMKQHVDALKASKHFKQGFELLPNKISNLLFASSGVYYTVTCRDFSKVYLGIKHVGLTLLVENYTGKSIAGISHKEKGNNILHGLEELYLQIEDFEVNFKFPALMQNFEKTLNEMKEYLYLHLKALRYVTAHIKRKALPKSPAFLEPAVAASDNLLKLWHPSVTISAEEELSLMAKAQAFAKRTQESLVEATQVVTTKETLKVDSSSTVECKFSASLTSPAPVTFSSSLASPAPVTFSSSTPDATRRSSAARSLLSYDTFNEDDLDELFNRSKAYVYGDDECSGFEFGDESPIKPQPAVEASPLRHALEELSIVTPMTLKSSAASQINPANRALFR